MTDDKSIIFFDPDKTFHKAKGEQCKRAFERIWRHFQCLLPTAHIKKRNKCQMMVNTYLFEMN